MSDNPPALPPPPGTPAADLDDGFFVRDDVPLPLNAGAQISVDKKTRKLDLPEQRFWLAVALLATVATLAIGLVLAVMLTGESRLEQVKSIAGIVFGPLVTLLGTSFAWYFAKNSDS